MNGKMLAILFLAGSSLLAHPRAFVSFGFGYAAPAPVYAYSAPPPPPVYYAQPSPGPGYSWVAGYYYPVGPRWVWRAGYWGRPRYARSYWVAPRYHGHRYYGGHWRRR